MEEVKIKKLKNRENEKGAVMVTVLLISLLLLVASAGVLLETTMNTRNVSDATADQQAYNAAESGIQSALNVLRGNVAPNPLFNATASDPANKIDFKKALRLTDSNLAADTSTVPHLSRWGLTYNPDRVQIGDPTQGYAYSLALSDPDNATTSITYNSSHLDSGFYNDATNVWVRTMTFGSGLNTATITFNPVSDTTVNVSSGSGTTNIGNFRVVVTGTGASIGAADIRFQIVLGMSQPYSGINKVVRGYMIGGTVINGSNTVKMYFDSPNINFSGSKVSTTLTTSNAVTPEYSLNLNTPVLLVGSTNVNATMTPAEPRRILIRSTGYGPRGAQKQLEAIVQKNYFDGLEAPASLTLIGASTGFVFNPGNSAQVNYSGDDIASTINIPAIGTNNATNLDYVNSNLPKTNVYPKPANVGVENPPWLSSPAALDAQVQMLKNIASSSGRLYPNASAATPPNFGDNYNATGITFVNGNATFSGSGGGILVVTGTLTFNGNVNFSGLILVTGAGGITRSGGGGGLLQGNTVVAPYDPTDLTKPFLAPKYNISGGGNSTLQYNSNSVANGMTAVSNLVLGVAEK
ncbi:MAG: hypothetical protein M3033_18865 [Acidobacteriota bacterium]|nr:hypothetical protein [Acidobacteriota bacterium]